MRLVCVFFLMLCMASAVPVRCAEREPAFVLEVVDGDTVRVDYNGSRKSVRLIGIDSPECRINQKAQSDARTLGRDVVSIVEQGGRSRAFVRSLVSSGSVVYLEFDIQTTDKYNRLLAYVYLPDGRMLNEEIVRAGFAGLMTIPPCVRYVDLFRLALSDARKNGRGLWETGKKPFPDRDRHYAVTRQSTSVR